MAVQTDYPWEETVTFSVAPASPVNFSLRLRVPGWCRSAKFTLNGEQVNVAIDSGYACLSRLWQAGDQVTLTLPMPVERVRADPRVAAVAGRVALQRGPIVYCLEEADHGADLAALVLPSEAAVVARGDPGLLGGCVVLEAAGWRESERDRLYSTGPAPRRPATLRAVPYALWANRGEGEMRVWIRE